MAEPWIVEECGHQLTLALAAAAWGQGEGFPEPTLPPGSSVHSALKANAAMLAGSAASADVIAACVHACLAASEADPSALPAEPWTLAELVGWWVRAGDALEAWDGDARAKLPGLLRCGAGREHPALWCRSRRRRLRFGRVELEADVQARQRTWLARPSCLHDYLGRLFRWATSCDRPGMPRPESNGAAWIDETLEAFADIESDYAALFGGVAAPVPAASLSWATWEEWIPRWFTAPVRGQLVHELRRPILVQEGKERRLQFKGLAAVTLPGWIVTQMMQGLPSALPNGNSFSRAAIVAASRWRDAALLSKELLDASAGKTRSLGPAAVDRLLLPAARCLVAGIDAIVEDQAEAEQPESRLGASSLGRHLVLSLALDGFGLRPCAPPQDEAGREIPHRGRDGVGRRGFAFMQAALGIDVPVGWLGAPAACQEALLAAIEAVDWRLWAYQCSPWPTGHDPVARLVGIVVEAARLPEWESLKRRVVHGAGDVDVLSRLYGHAQTRFLAVQLLGEKAYAGAEADPMLAGLRDEYGTLARAVLAELGAIDPQAPARLHPPRRPDGGVDVVAWIEKRRSGGDQASGWHIEWDRDARPIGTVIAERRRGSAYVVSVSAGAMADADFAFLRLPALSIGDRESRPAAAALADTVGRFQAELAAICCGQAAQRDGTAAVAALRDAFAGPRAPEFDELIQRWVNADDSATAWVEALAADPRFGFACTPPIDLASRAMPAPRPEDAFLEWAFDPEVPAGGDAKLQFAIDPSLARRVISRGDRIVGAPPHLAEAVVAATGSGPLLEKAVALQRATDLWLTFPNHAPHPAVAAGQLLDALLDPLALTVDHRATIHAAAAAWCSAVGHEVVPQAWEPERPLSPEACGGAGLPHAFQDQVPAGSVIVRCFGLRGTHGRPFVGAISAGPTPAGFVGLRDAVAGLAAAGPPWEAIAQRVDDLARHAFVQTLPLACSNLFDALWEAAGTVDQAELQQFAEAAKSSLCELLKGSCGMVAFEPSAVGDYPTGWIRESDGKQPRGRRIRRLVRPGLRTLENKLVRPAFVTTE